MIPNEIKELTDNQLREAIQSLQNSGGEKSLLRVLSLKINGRDYVTDMLILAVPLALELEKRTSNIPQYE